MRRASVLALAMLAVAGCSSGPQSNVRTVAVGASAAGPTVAFESIDGPPPAVFDRLVHSLGEEAGARSIPVVSRLEPATYRVRGYVAASVHRTNTSFGWVWDVYGRDRRRVLRIAGEEIIAGRHEDAWAAADERVLRRIAGKGLERMALFLREPGQATEVAAVPTLMTLVSTREDTPEAAGIVRFQGREPEAAAMVEAAQDDPMPLRRPKFSPSRPAPATTGQATAATAPRDVAAASAMRQP